MKTTLIEACNGMIVKADYIKYFDYEEDASGSVYVYMHLKDGEKFDFIDLEGKGSIEQARAKMKVAIQYIIAQQGFISSDEIHAIIEDVNEEDPSQKSPI